MRNVESLEEEREDEQEEQCQQNTDNHIPNTVPCFLNFFIISCWEHEQSDSIKERIDRTCEDKDDNDSNDRENKISNSFQHAARGVKKWTLKLYEMLRCLQDEEVRKQICSPDYKDPQEHISKCLSDSLEGSLVVWLGKETVSQVDNDQQHNKRCQTKHPVYNSKQELKLYVRENSWSYISRIHRISRHFSVRTKYRFYDFFSKNDRYDSHDREQERGKEGLLSWIISGEDISYCIYECEKEENSQDNIWKQFNKR